jgi:hypothetical protein
MRTEIEIRELLLKAKEEQYIAVEWVKDARKRNLESFELKMALSLEASITTKVATLEWVLEEPVIFKTN